MYSVLDPSRHTASASACYSVFLFIFWSVEMFFSCLWLYHSILLLFLFTIIIAIFEGKGTFKCMNYRLMLARKPPVSFQDPIAISYPQNTAAKYTQHFLLFPHHSFTPQQPVVNSQFFIEASLRKVTDDLCTPHSNECSSHSPRHFWPL